MSTKSTIASGEGFVIYKDMFDSSNIAHLVIDGEDFTADSYGEKKAIQLKINVNKLVEIAKHIIKNEDSLRQSFELDFIEREEAWNLPED
jgi:hypothetical protein